MIISANVIAETFCPKPTENFVVESMNHRPCLTNESFCVGRAKIVNLEARRASIVSAHVAQIELAWSCDSFRADFSTAPKLGGNGGGVVTNTSRLRGWPHELQVKVYHVNKSQINPANACCNIG